MIDLFIVLLLVHLLGDFVFQNDWLIALKKKFWGQLLHSFIIFLICVCLIPESQGLFLAWIMAGSHFFIDFIKTKLNRHDNLKLFLIDQGIHVFVILFLVFTLGLHYQLFWFYQSREAFLKILLVCIGIIMNTSVSNWIVVKFFKIHYPNEHFETGLQNAGKYIGHLERLILMLTVLTSNSAAIGFLITAKFILRIGKLTDKDNKKEAEYIILGTFLSIVLALCWSYTVLYLMGMV